MEFDAYVPVTITWPEALDLLEPPTYLAFSSGESLLELKFHPSSYRIVEVALVNAPSIIRGDRSLRPVTEDKAAVACWRNEGADGLSETALDVTAFDDCLVVSWSTVVVAHWVGCAPVYFGQGDQGNVVALCVNWSASDRDHVLGGDRAS